MEKTSKVANVIPADEFDYNGEHYYKWEVTFENGDNGEVNTKKDQSPWQVGEEAEYILTPSKGPYPDRIKKVYRRNSGGGFSASGKGESSNSKNRGIVLAYAKDMMVVTSAFKDASDEDDLVSAAHAVCKMADIFYDWVSQG